MAFLTHLSNFPQSNQPDPTLASSTPQPQSSTPPSTPITVNFTSNPPQLLPPLPPCNVPGSDTKRRTTQYCPFWALQPSRFCPWFGLTVSWVLPSTDLPSPERVPHGRYTPPPQSQSQPQPQPQLLYAPPPPPPVMAMGYRFKVAGLSALGCGCHRGVALCLARSEVAGSSAMGCGVALCLARSEVAGSSAMGCGCRRGLWFSAWVLFLLPWWVVVAMVGL
uniref:Uncharacterized protein n=1 Tax=Fagus sylvatica TaxID=28930 RepID=A0A2N9H0I7_FAGSY